MQSLGHKPSEEELREMIAEVDQDGNGEIDFDEFCFMMKRIVASDESLHDIKLAFKMFDADGSGSISKEELRDALTQAGNKISEAEFNELFDETDADGSGEIDYGEFVTMLTS